MESPVIFVRATICVWFLVQCVGSNPGCDNKHDIVIILDSSTSVTGVNFKKMLGFSNSIVNSSDINSGAVRVGVLIYSTKTKTQFHLNTYTTKSEVMSKIDNIPYISGSTNTAGSLKKVRTEMFNETKGDRPNVPNTIILVTDGISNINARRTIPEAKAAHAEGIHIVAIGIGLSDRRELDGIASKPVSKYSFSVDNFDQLHTLDSEIVSVLGLNNNTVSTQCQGI